MGKKFLTIRQIITEPINYKLKLITYLFYLCDTS